MGVESEIRAEMAFKRISVAELSMATGMNRDYLSRQLNEKRQFTSGEVVLIGKALGVPGWELMRRSINRPDMFAESK